MSKDAELQKQDKIAKLCWYTDWSYRCEYLCLNTFINSYTSIVNVF